MRNETLRESKVERVASLVRERLQRPSDVYPLSSAQSRIWMLYRLNPRNHAYHLPALVRLPRFCQISTLEVALRLVIARHESILVRFFEAEDGVFQQVFPIVKLPIRHVVMESVDNAGERNRLVRNEIERRFRLFEEMPIRLLRIGDDKGLSYLLFVAHHVVCDGASLGILLRQVIDTYGELTNGSTSARQVRASRLREILEWQDRGRNENRISRQVEYWKNALSSVEPIDLPLFGRRPQVYSYKGKRKSIIIEERMVKEAREFCRAEKITIFTLLLAVYRLLLYRHTAQTDFVVGVPVSGRNGSGSADSVGMFVNTLPLRLKMEKEETFREYVCRLRKACVEDMANGDAPFERIVEEVRAPVDYSRTPIYQVMFQFFPADSELKWEVCEIEDEWSSSKVDLSTYVREKLNVWKVVFEYNTDLFIGEYVSGLSTQFRTVLGNAIKDPETPIYKLEILGDEERSLLQEFNATEADYPDDRRIDDLFEEQAEKTPGLVAAAFEGEELTYRELRGRVNGLARELREEYGVGPGVIVGLCLDRSLEMIVGILGVLKAGGAYLPVDPSYPPDRIGYMLEDSAAKLLLVRGEAPPGVSFEGRALDLLDGGFRGEGAGAPESARSPGDLAYVIYTSGSTGRPKGVMVEHRGIVNRLLWMRDAYGIGTGDAILQKTPYTFDVSVWELLLPPLCGARLHFLKPGGEKDPEAIGRAIEAFRISTVHFVPSMLEAFLGYLPPGEGRRFTSLKRLICSGEALSLSHKRTFFERFAHGVELHNLYGPTEASVDVTSHRVLVGDERMPIGAPVANTRMFVLEASGSLCPLGVSGELCIGGVQLARGYLNRPDLTREKFVADPYRPGERLYRTGDLGRWLPGGELEYLGRMDSQVKIRGFRIELGEIETALLRIDEVQQAIVAVKEVNDEKTLVAYYTQVSVIQVSDLRRKLRRTLPDYMIPSYFIVLDMLPVTSNGKADRKNLPEVVEFKNDEMNCVSAESETEIELEAICKEVLNLDRIDICSNFFDIGGNSMLILSMHKIIKKRLDDRLTVTDLFENPTVQSLAAFIDKQKRSDLKSAPVLGESNRNSRIRSVSALRKKRSSSRD